MEASWICSSEKQDLIGRMLRHFPSRNKFGCEFAAMWNDWQRKLRVCCDISSRFLSSPFSRYLAKLKSQTSAHYYQFNINLIKARVDSYQCAENFGSHYLNLVKVETCVSKGKPLNQMWKLVWLNHKGQQGGSDASYSSKKACFSTSKLKEVSSRGLFQLTNEASGAGLVQA